MENRSRFTHLIGHVVAVVMIGCLVMLRDAQRQIEVIVPLQQTERKIRLISDSMSLVQEMAKSLALRSKSKEAASRLRSSRFVIVSR